LAGNSESSAHVAWAHLRFSVVGPLLSSPPPPGQLKAAITALSDKSWRHPVTGEPVRFAFSTIERWYYQARRARQDPVGVLRRRVRKDAGRHSVLGEPLAQKLIEQYRQYKHWSVKLHHDNLCVLAQEDPSLGKVPSYSSVLRFIRACGMDKQRRRRDAHRPGVARAQARLEDREVRSFEAQYINGLWHLDLHKSSLRVLTPQGHWVHPHLLGVLDDHSRLACHTQWYWSETAEDLVHGLSQAFCKRGLPRTLLTDNGSAMMAEEVRQGLRRLGIVHDTTLPYSPYQNGKQEVFWATVEGRLMAMLHGVEPLTLDLLNQATQAWVEMEYNRTRHSQTGQKPLDRFLKAPDVGRPSPSSEVLNQAFRQDVTRTQRRSDGTITIEAVRFELPNRFGHLRQLTVRYARWNLRSVHLVDPRTDTLLAPIYPLDKASNADGRRRVLGSAALTPTAATDQASPPMAPLLRKLMADYAATGIPPAYVPKPDPTNPNQENSP
jgi:transposase InsO family protein